MASAFNLASSMTVDMSHAPVLVKASASFRMAACASGEAAISLRDNDFVTSCRMNDFKGILCRGTLTVLTFNRRFFA
eukprot:7078752-Karenia_brevis.AAC.1